MSNTTFALYVSNRTTFPQEIVKKAISEYTMAIKRNGFGCLDCPFPVDNHKDGQRFADFLAQHRGEYQGVIAVFPNFGDESSTLTALRDSGVPILFQAYPDKIGEMGVATRRDAFCGKVSVMNLFRQAQVPCTSLLPHTVHPDSPEFDANLQTFGKICRIVNGMKRVRCGSIGTRCTPFKTVRFDETALERYGITNEAFDLSGILAAYDKISDNEPELAELEQHYANYSKWPDNSGAVIKRIAKLTLVIKHLIDDYQLDLVTLRCWTELEEKLQLSPCIILSVLNDQKIIANCEVDTIGALAMRIFSLASDEPAACLDWNNNFGNDPDKCVLFHCGPTAKSLLQDAGEVVDNALLPGSCIGCHIGRLKPGTFTCGAGYTREGKLHIYLGQGEFTDDQLEAAFFGTGGVAKFDRLQEKMLHITKAGFPHHVALAYGNHLTAVKEALGEYLKYEIIDL